MAPNRVAITATNGLTVESETVDSSTGRHLRFTVRNPFDTSVNDWAVEVHLPSFVTGVYGAHCNAVGSTKYRITPDQWCEKLPPKGELTFGLLLS